jgi:hypothetical protein
VLGPLSNMKARVRKQRGRGGNWRPGFVGGPALKADFRAAGVWSSKLTRGTRSSGIRGGLASTLRPLGH